MSNLTSIRRRIKSAKNISQITKAMEMVAASKMRKAQETALATRPYSEKLNEIISNLSGRINLYEHPLLEKRAKINSVAVLIVSTNRGLCGSLNTSLFRAISLWLKEQDGNPNINFITIGKRAHSFVKNSEPQFLAEFDSLEESPSFESVRPIASMLMQGYLEHQYDKVVVVYTRFLNTLSQETTVKELLPAHPLDIAEASYIQKDYVFEPSPTALINWVIPYRFELMLYQTVLDARASEHSARMVAMKNAHDNAQDLVGGLTIDYNRERQSSVTNELLDVTTARAALGE